MMKKIYFLFLLLILLGCKKSSTTDSADSSSTSSWSSNDDFISNDDEDLNGTYCAEVEYYNPSTGTRSTYELDVEVENGYLVQIDWPNGGWLDETHFSSEDISSGECSFTSDRGYQYTVTLGEKGGGCYSDGRRLQNAVNEDVENTTCPKCGDEKDEYDTYCNSCKRKIENEEQERQNKIEHTCTSCGGYKFSSFDDLCNNCKRREEEE